MGSDHYIHPEFGYLAPTRRFRRELRGGLLSMLLGMGIGVVASSGINHYQGRSSEPSAGAHDVVADSGKQTQSAAADVPASPAPRMRFPARPSLTHLRAI